jgi:hypothetical protein
MDTIIIYFGYLTVNFIFILLFYGIGSPFYQLGAVVATPPVQKKKIKTRRSMSMLPGSGVMLPVSSEVINSLAPLCLPGKYNMNKMLQPLPHDCKLLMRHNMQPRKVLHWL